MNIDKLRVYKFLLLIVIFFLVTSLFINKFAQALNPSDYAKGPADQLNAVDWNRLASDFVAKSGDTMTGNLNLSGSKVTNLGGAPYANSDAVNFGSMTSAITTALSSAGQIKDLTGNNLKMICGRTTPGSTVWTPYGGGAYTEVDLTTAGFTPGSSPFIFTSLGGTGFHFMTRGANSIYPIGTNPLSRGFQAYVLNDSGVGNAFSIYQWHINWCALGN